MNIDAKVVGHGRYVAFQLAEVAVPRSLFAEIPRLIAELRPPLDSAAARHVRSSCVSEKRMGEVVLITAISTLSGLTRSISAHGERLAHGDGGSTEDQPCRKSRNGPT